MKTNPDDSPFDLELDSYWKMKFNRFRDRWSNSEPVAQPQNREEEIPEQSPAPEPAAAAPPTPAMPMPMPLVVLSTVLVSVLGTVFFLGGFTERNRVMTPDAVALKKQLEEQHSSFDVELAKANATKRDLEAKLKVFDEERVRLDEQIKKLEEDRNRLALQLETGRIERNIVETEITEEPPTPIQATPILRVAPNPQGPFQRYTVREGDTLTRIAKHSGVSVAELSRLNNLASPNHLMVGQQMLLPAKANMEALNRAVFVPEPRSEYTPPSRTSQPVRPPKANRFVQQ